MQSIATLRWLALFVAGVSAAATGFLFGHTTLILVVLALPTAEQGVAMPFWVFMVLVYVLSMAIVTSAAAVFYIYSRLRIVTWIFWTTAIITEAVIGIKAVQ